MPQRIAHGAGLAAVLAALWQVLSGHTEPLILAFGVLSVAFAVGAAWRMHLLDREGAPLSAPHRRAPYLLWLGGQIAAANIQVVKLALRPKLALTPALVRIPSTAASPLGLAVFANSITLTPGTVSVDVEPDFILVHALDESLADAEVVTGMGRRAARAFDPAGRASGRPAGRP